VQLEEWAARWGVPYDALADLRTRVLGLDWQPGETVPGRSEAAVQNEVRLDMTAKGGRLWRNNVGAMQDQSGAFVRFGLANESAQINARVKSADLVGLRPVLIEPHHVGKTIGQFVAREVKAGGWRFTGTDRERAQLAWLVLVLSLGGDAKFANGVETQ